MVWVWFWAVLTAVQLAALARALVADHGDRVLMIALFLFASTTGLVREYRAARRPAREAAAQRPRS